VRDAAAVFGGDLPDARLLAADLAVGDHEASWSGVVATAAGWVAPAQITSA